MCTVKIPYYKENIELQIPKKNLQEIITSKIDHFVTPLPEKEIVNQALDQPVNCDKIEELVQDKKNMVIITSDHTRPVPSRITLPIILKRIRGANSKIKIKILVATGCHRAMAKNEMIEKFGSNIVEKEEILMHDSKDNTMLAQLEQLPSGGELWINKEAVETELLVAEGFIEPHFFAGFSGGRKSILPGIAGYQTVLSNHCSKFIANENCQAGVLENNPIHQDMVFAAKTARLAFIFNVVINSEKRIIKAFSGDFEEAHKKGCRFLQEQCSSKATKTDIVITSNGGYPLGQNIYQTVKGMSTAEKCCKTGGVIIMVSSCIDGHGGESFYNQISKSSSPEELYKQTLKVPQNQTVMDQWEYQILARILMKHTVIMVTKHCSPKMITEMRMLHASTAEEALEKAFQLKGADAKITVIPDGVSVIIE